MKPVINLFFSGKEVQFPEGNGWEKFGPGLDTVRLFEVCAASWRRAGWEVRRLSVLDKNFNHTSWAADGQCRKSFSWYPADQWQFIAAAKAVAAQGNPSQLHWFTCIDVINQRFFPQDSDGFDQNCPRFLNFQKEHFSLSLFATNHLWLVEAEKILLAYDRGDLAPLDRAYVSDETILRFYASGVDNHPLLSFALDPDRDLAPLLHFSRSTAARLYHEIPLSLS